MAFDAFLRLYWFIPIMLKSYIPSVMADPWLNFLFLILEVIRRGQWNVFRLENEHLNNCGAFRAVIDVPLPFEEEQEFPDESKKESSKKGFISNINSAIRFLSYKKLGTEDIFFCFDSRDDERDQDIESESCAQSSKKYSRLKSSIINISIQGSPSFIMRGLKDEDLDPEIADTQKELEQEK
jgi:hypothetical protein